MTPEEWAKKAENALMEGGARTFEGCVAWAIQKAVEEEREACKQVAANMGAQFHHKAMRDAADAIAEAVSARSNGGRGKK